MNELKQKVYAKIGIPTEEQRLIFSGKQLEEGKKLSDYPKLDNHATIFLILRLPGGALQGLPTSRNDPCIICYCDDDVLPLIMPCACKNGSHDHTVMHPKCLMEFSWNQVFGKKGSICCPQCQSEWTLDVIERYGRATKEEVEMLSECLSKNSISDNPSIIECPGCHSFCQRIDETNPRVCCRICQKKPGKKNFEFCWHCQLQWKSKNRTSCGNASCNSATILDQIQSAPYKEINNVQTPSIRLCPNCGTAIEHEEACKHMTCKKCKCDFCFICLRKKVKDNWQCGSISTKCTSAPVQTRVPSLQQ